MKEYVNPDGTFDSSTMLGHELSQLSRLRAVYPNLSTEELAHRMTTTKKQVVKMLKMLGE